MFRPPPFGPRSRTARQAWLWCLAALLVLKAAVPLLAATAAGWQGVSLVKVCTVYGVRTAVVAAAMPAGHGHPDSPVDSLPGHGGGEHCALASLAAGPLPNALPAVLAHAPPQAPLATPVVAATLPADAVRRWLSARWHAPPVSGFSA